MLDWLKGILGDGYTEETDRKVSAEIGKNFVAKADFNGVKAELKAAKEAVSARDGQLEELRKSSGDLDALKAQITELQAANQQEAEAHEAELNRLRKGAALQLALGDSVYDPSDIIARLDLDKVELDEKGGLKTGLDTLIAPIREEKPYLFKPDKAPDKPVIHGIRPADPTPRGEDGASDSGPVII